MGMNLLELADRCEAATGPSRELDIAIIETFGWQKKSKGWFLSDEWWERGNERLYRSQIPQFTASLDAAMTLVPEGWHLGLYHRPDGVGGWTWMADFWESALMTGGSTPALALCAAALRARAAQ